MDIRTPFSRTRVGYYSRKNTSNHTAPGVMDNAVDKATSLWLVVVIVEVLLPVW
jgi:hypothetical protein